MSSCVIEISSEDSSNGDEFTSSNNAINNGTSPIQDIKPSGSEVLNIARNIVANKRYKRPKPGEYLKRTIIEMHPRLLGLWYCADVVREAKACGVQVKPCPTLIDQSLVLFARTEEQELTTSSEGTVGLSPRIVRGEHGLYICSAEEAAPLVEQRALAQHLQAASDRAGCPLTLVLFGVKDYFKASVRKTLNSSRKLMTELDLEMALTDLLVSSACSASVANTAGELALAVVLTAKAVAEAPFKKAKQALDEKAEFYMRGDNKNCVAVDSKGHGVERLWQQMLAVLPQSSLEAARALCERHRAPRALYQALQSPEGVANVAEIRVPRAHAPLCKHRRVGPELARRLRTLLRASDGRALLD